MDTELHRQMPETPRRGYKRWSMHEDVDVARFGHHDAPGAGHMRGEPLSVLGGHDPVGAAVDDEHGYADRGDVEAPGPGGGEQVVRHAVRSGGHGGAYDAAEPRPRAL